MSPPRDLLAVLVLFLCHAAPVQALPAIESFGTLQRSQSRIPISDLAELGEITIILMPEDVSLRVDLATVLSPYIGESEKNLDRLMARAVDCGAVLLFDEADPLFGQGSQLLPLSDEYANQEVSYLLIPLTAINRGLTPQAAGKLGLRFWALPDAVDLWTAYEIQPLTGAILLLDKDGFAVNVGTVEEVVQIASAQRQKPESKAAPRQDNRD